MLKISKRQQQIFDFIQKNGISSNSQIIANLAEKEEKISRYTVIRELEKLLSEGVIIKKGKGRNIAYALPANASLLKFIDPEIYFKVSSDERKISKDEFNFEIFEEFQENLFSVEEILQLEKKNKTHQKRIAMLSPILLKKELERLSIDFSWKSSKIEGNTYDLLETEQLIKNQQQARGHSQKEATMILNNKDALKYILEQKSEFKKLTLAKIENAHALVVNELGVQKNIRKRLVGITGTRFRPLDNEFQIREALEKVIEIVNNKKIHPLSKALATVLLISYIQPFEDGNKRTARILGNAILLANGYCPLSYRSVDDLEYKKATLLFYEQNSAYYFKKLFKEQFEFAVENYF